MSYSKTLVGEVGTDGVHRDWQGNVIPSGLDEDTKRQLQEQLDGPRIRVLPSENDILNAASQGKAVASGDTYVNPNESEDAAALAYKPGYAVTDASSTGDTTQEAKPDTPAPEQAS